MSTLSHINSLYLMVTLKTNEGLSWQLSFQHSPLVIGRGERSDIRLPYSWISLQHAEICWSKEGITAHDLLAKTPARYRGISLTHKPLPLLPSLTLSLPTLSLSFELSSQHLTPSSPAQSAYITRQLWRPESGWLLWTSIPSPSFTVKRFDTPPSLSPSRSKAPPEPLISHPWRSALSPSHQEEMNTASAYTTSQVEGLCWFINIVGYYKITNLQTGHHLAFKLDNMSLHYNDNTYTYEGDEEHPLLLKGTDLILTRDAQPPLRELFGLGESPPKKSWWYRLLSLQS